MGWSCGVAAAHTLDAWNAACIEQGGSQNSYAGKDGRHYFFEVSRREHDDGAITGTTWRENPDGQTVRKAGSFRIEGSGEVAKYPTAWPFKKEVAIRG